MPKVSIIVPVYKAEKYLERCVNSLQNQTLRDLEIILVDDGSPDQCPGCSPIGWKSYLLIISSSENCISS